LAGTRGLFSESVGPVREAEVGYYPPIRRMRDEWELLELWARCHPLAGLKKTLRRMQVTRSGRLPELVGRRVRTVGLAAAGRATRAGSGKLMGFMSLSDEDGLFEVTLFPEVWRRSRRMLGEGGLGPFVVEGRVESQYGALSVTAERLDILTQRHGATEKNLDGRDGVLPRSRGSHAAFASPCFLDAQWRKETTDVVQ
jgi:DNA polymerase-3 subunit alpha